MDKGLCVWREGGELRRVGLEQKKRIRDHQKIVNDFVVCVCKRYICVLCRLG